MEPEPVRIAPLKSPSMDSEFANARRICGCAGTETVNGICEIAIDGAGAAAAITLEDQHTSNVQQADASVCTMRPCEVFDISLCIMKFLKDLGLTNNRLKCCRR